MFYYKFPLNDLEQYCMLFNRIMTAFSSMVLALSNRLNATYGTVLCLPLKYDILTRAYDRNVTLYNYKIRSFTI